MPADGIRCSMLVSTASNARYPMHGPVQETLRKYSIVPVVTRVAARDTTLCGYPIPAGCYIACILQVLTAWPGGKSACQHLRMDSCL